jgi:hypothetical protein
MKNDLSSNGSKLSGQTGSTIYVQMTIGGDHILCRPASSGSWKSVWAGIDSERLVVRRLCNRQNTHTHIANKAEVVKAVAVNNNPDIARGRGSRMRVFAHVCDVRQRPAIIGFLFPFAIQCVDSV